jgi:hypothetical protein
VLILFLTGQRRKDIRDEKANIDSHYFRNPTHTTGTWNAEDMVDVDVE